MSGRSPLLLSTSPALAHNYTFLLWPDGQGLVLGFFSEEVMSNVLVRQYSAYPLNKPFIHFSSKDKIMCVGPELAIFLLLLPWNAEVFISATGTDSFIYYFSFPIAPDRLVLQLKSAEALGVNLRSVFFNNKAHSSWKLLYVTSSVF